MKTKTYNVKMIDDSIIKVTVFVYEIEKYGIQAIKDASEMSDKSINLVLEGHAKNCLSTVKSIQIEPAEIHGEPLKTN